MMIIIVVLLIFFIFILFFPAFLLSFLFFNNNLCIIERFLFSLILSFFFLPIIVLNLSSIISVSWINLVLLSTTLSIPMIFHLKKTIKELSVDITFQKEDKLLLLILSIISLIYVCSFINYDFPMRGGGDTYAYIAYLKVLKNIMGLSNYCEVPNLFPYLYRKDPRLGVNVITMSIISGLINIDEITTVMIAGVFNIFILYFSLYSFVNRLVNSRAVALLSVLLLIVISPIGGVGADFEYFSYPFLLFYAHHPQLFGLGVAFALLTIDLYQLYHKSLRILLLKAILVIILFTSHPLSGLIYIITFFILSIVYRSESVRKYILLSFSAILTGVVISNYYPFNSQMNGFITMLNMIVGTHESSIKQLVLKEKCLQPAIWIGLLRSSTNTLLLPSYGLIFFKKNRKEGIFLLFWMLTLIFIALPDLGPWATINPIPIMLYRFIIIAKVPLIISISESTLPFILKTSFKTRFSKHVKLQIIFKEKYRKREILSALLLIMVVSISAIDHSGLKHLTSLGPSELQFLFLHRFDDEGGVLLAANPSDSYVIQAITNFSVITIPGGNLPSPLYLSENMKRTLELYETFKANDADTWLKTIRKYNVTHILIRKRYFLWFAIGVTLRSNYIDIVNLLNNTYCKVIYSDDYFILLKTKDSELRIKE